MFSACISPFFWGGNMYGSSNTGFDRSGAMGSSARVPFAARYGRVVVVLLVCLLASVSVRAQATLDDVVNAIGSMESNLRGDLSGAASTIANSVDAAAGQNFLGGVESLLATMQYTMSGMESAAAAIQASTDNLEDYTFNFTDHSYFMYNILNSVWRGSTIGVSVEGGDGEWLKNIFSSALTQWSEGDGSEGSGASLSMHVDPWAVDDASVEEVDTFSMPDVENPVHGFEQNFGQAQTEVFAYQEDRQHIESEVGDKAGIWDRIKDKIMGIYEAYSVENPTGIHWSVGGWTLIDMTASDFLAFGAIRNIMPFVWGAVFLGGAVQIIERGVA